MVNLIKQLEQKIEERINNFYFKLDKVYKEKFEKSDTMMVEAIEKIIGMYEEESVLNDLLFDYIESKGLKEDCQSYLRDVVINGIKSELKKRKGESSKENSTS